MLLVGMPSDRHTKGVIGAPVSDFTNSRTVRRDRLVSTSGVAKAYFVRLPVYYVCYYSIYSHQYYAVKQSRIQDN
jgi:hypothetical protein